MGEDRLKGATRKYVESLTPEERAEYTRVMLASAAEEPGDTGAPKVPPTTLLVSRFASGALLVSYLVITDWAAVNLLEMLWDFILPMAVVWFPNQLERAIGRLRISRRIRKVSSPWPLLILGWIMLLIPIVLLLLEPSPPA
jgi:hypothetical protein